MAVLSGVRPPRTSWLEVGKTYQYNSWMFVVIREPGPGGMPGSVEVMSLTDYGDLIKSGHLVEVTHDSAVGSYSVQVA